MEHAIIWTVNASANQGSLASSAQIRVQRVDTADDV